uniref:Phosphate carrier protein, mitochondrial n=1 Tax=Parascaris equorum TaxID=6256 RepID=A0A914RPG6_PAREQ
MTSETSSKAPLIMRSAFIRHTSPQPGEVPYGSLEFFAYCGLGGIISCGTTHTSIVPLDLVKCRIQVDPTKYRGIISGFSTTIKEEGIRALGKGWAPTCVGLPPLWLRQIPYTMMKFACFERTVEMLYKYVVPKPRSQCSKPEQLVVTFIAGYIAGIFCAIVSHPADTIVSKLNQEAGETSLSIAKKLGFMGLWKGLVPRIIMIGTLTAAQWFIYDSVKVIFKLPRPPPPEMPESLKLKLKAAGKL